MAKKKRSRPSDPPLTWWRSVPFSELDARSADALAGALRNIEILGDGRWRNAKSGDASAAVGCAVPLLSSEVHGPSLDAAMTAVLMCALRGDRAALMVVIHASRTRIGAGRDAAGAGRNPRQGSKP